MGCFIFCFLRRRLRWLWLHYYCPFALQQQDRIRFVVNAEGGGSSSLSLFTGSFSSAATMPCMKNWSVLKLSPSSSSSVPSVLFLLSFFRRTIERRAGKTWWRRWRTMRRVHSTQLAEERPTHRRNGECQNIIRRGMWSLGKGTKEKRVRLRNQFLCPIVNAQRSGTHAKSPQIKTYHCEDVVIVEELLLLLRTANEVFQLFV